MSDNYIPGELAGSFLFLGAIEAHTHGELDLLKGKGVNWLHFAIEV